MIASDSPSGAGIPHGSDLAEIMDRGRWSLYQKAVVGLVALAIIFDGFDNQVLGFSLPLISKEWGAGREVFAPVFALGFVGMVIGTIVGGWLGDRIGRRAGLILSVVIFAVATGVTALAHDVTFLIVCRIIAGIGLGGAMPCATTLLAEFSPTSKRSLAVTLGIVCIPLGGVVGGLIAARILPTIGWRMLFMIGGALPLAVALLLTVALPESPRFLLRTGRTAAALKILKRIAGDRSLPEPLRDSSDTAEVKAAAVSTLFSGLYRRDTISLWIAFFFCLLGTYLVFNWAPTFLVSTGFDVGQSSQALATFNIGGVIGAILAAVWMTRVGSRLSLSALAAAAVVGAGMLAVTPFGASGHTLVLVALFFEGAFVNAVQTGLYALAANAYPAGVRASGVGMTAGLGRAGAIASAFAGVVVLAGGAHTYFAAIGAAMAVSLVAILIVRRHVLPVRRQSATDGQPS